MNWLALGTKIHTEMEQQMKTVFFYLRDFAGHPIGVFMLERLTDQSRGDFAISASLCAKSDAWDKHEGQRIARYRMEHQTGPLWRAGQLLIFGMGNLLKLLLGENTARIRDVDWQRAKATLGAQVNRLMDEEYYREHRIGDFVVQVAKAYPDSDFPWVWRRFHVTPGANSGKLLQDGYSESPDAALYYAGFWDAKQQFPAEWQDGYKAGHFAAMNCCRAGELVGESDSRTYVEINGRRFYK